MESQKSEKEQKKDLGTSDASGSIATKVATHYNEVKEVGLVERKNSRIFFLRNFNNWIKSTLIGDEMDSIKSDIETKLKSLRKLSVMDLCSGKGGDIKKWMMGPVSHVIFTDIAETSMEQCNSRYRTLPSRWNTFTAEFITADCTKIKLREKMKDVTKSLDLVSCQFAFHYCFESLPQAEIMLKNASECLRPGGRFIGTLPNAREIVRRLEEGGGSFGNELFHIKTDCEPPYPLFGAKYDFKLEGVVDCPEFLVHFPTLVRLAKKFGLKLLYTDTFPAFFEKKKAQNKRLLIKMSALEAYPAPESTSLVGPPEHYTHADKYLDSNCSLTGTLSKAEWEAASLYLIFGFEKVATLSWDKDCQPVYDFS